MIRVGVAAHTVRSNWLPNRWHRSGTVHTVIDQADWPAGVELGTNITVDVTFEPKDLPMLRAVVDQLTGRNDARASVEAGSHGEPF